MTSQAPLPRPPLLPIITGLALTGWLNIVVGNATLGQSFEQRFERYQADIVLVSNFGHYTPYPALFIPR